MKVHPWLKKKLSVTSWTTVNAPTRNNNPWDIKKWDIWYWVDYQGHTIFPDIETWFQALKDELTAKLTWKSRFKELNPNATLSQLAKRYATDPNWINNVSDISWYSPNTKLKDINVTRLAIAVARAEWYKWQLPLK